MGGAHRLKTRRGGVLSYGIGRLTPQRPRGHVTYAFPGSRISAVPATEGRPAASALPAYDGEVRKRRREAVGGAANMTGR